MASINSMCFRIKAGYQCEYILKQELVHIKTKADVLKQTNTHTHTKKASFDISSA